MKKLLGLLVVVLVMVPFAGAQTREDLGPPGPGAPVVGPPGPIWHAPLAVLFDNGPLVNSVGTGPGGANESIARDTTVGLTSRGFNVSAATSYRGADDFTVPAGGWNVTTITFFPYMGNSPTSPSPITAVYLQIWNGLPGVGSVVWGDLTTNRLASTAFANIYRRLESTPTDATRPVMSAVATVNTTLAAGTYWLDWSVDGSASYTGPWQPPVTIDGQTTTGNAQQYTGSWVAAVDAGLGTALGFPFIIEGTVVPVELTTFTVD